MKTKYIVATIAVMMAAQAHGQQALSSSSSQTADKFTLQQKVEIADAINFLVEDGALNVRSKECLNTDDNVAAATDPKQKVEIKEAMNLLVDEKVLKVVSNDCLQFDGNIISELRKLGLLEYGDSQVLTVCIGPGKIAH